MYKENYKTRGTDRMSADGALFSDGTYQRGNVSIETITKAAFGIIVLHKLQDVCICLYPLIRILNINVYGWSLFMLLYTQDLYIKDCCFKQPGLQEASF